MSDVFDIRDIIVCYLEHNHLTIRYMAKKTGLKEDTLKGWLYRTNNLSEEKMKKAYNFMSGNFILSIDKICELLDLDKEQTPEQDIVKLFLKYNTFSVNYMSKVAHIPEVTLREWLKGNRRIKKEYILRMNEVMNGGFLIPMSTICGYLMMQRGGNEENDS